jgi:hypothetical protein
MATQQIAQDNSLSQLTNILDIVAGKSSTQTTKSNVSAEGVNAILQQILGGTQGLAQVASGQKSAGMYNATTNQQLINDLITRTSGEVAKQTAGTTTTTKQNPQVGGSTLATAALALGANKILGPSIKGLASKTGVDKWGDKLAESLGISAPTDSAAVDTMLSAPASGAGAAGVGADAWAPASIGAETGMAADAGLAAVGTEAVDTAGIDAALASGTNAAATTAGADVAGAAVADSAGADLGAEAAVALWVICTELNAQGRLSDNLYAASGARALKLPQDVLDGYHYWAVPLTKKLRKSVFLSAVFQYLATSRCEYLLGKPRFWGWASVVLGEPICAMIGRKLIAKTDWKVLYG